LLRAWEDNTKRIRFNFYIFPRGSVYELETLLNIAVIVGIMNEPDFEKFIPVLDEVIKLLNGLINYMEKANLK